MIRNDLYFITDFENRSLHSDAIDAESIFGCSFSFGMAKPEDIVFCRGEIDTAGVVPYRYLFFGNCYVDVDGGLEVL